jgi:hypothetical protein
MNFCSAARLEVHQFLRVRPAEHWNIHIHSVPETKTLSPSIAICTLWMKENNGWIANSS